MINFSLEYLEQADDHRSHVTRTLRQIKNQFNINDNKVIEIGCGLARNLEHFRATNEVCGVDGLVGAVNDVCARGIEAEFADLEQGSLPFADGSFDVVVCIDVLEHINNVKSLMMEIKRIAKDDALIILNVPNHFTLKGRLKLLFGAGMDMHNFFPGSDDWDNPHIRFFTHSGFHRLLDSCGLKTVSDMSEFVTFEGLGHRKALSPTTPLKKILAKLFPALFLGGFFVVARKI